MYRGTKGEKREAKKLLCTDCIFASSITKQCKTVSNLLLRMDVIEELVVGCPFREVKIKQSMRNNTLAATVATQIETSKSIIDNLILESNSIEQLKKIKSK